jgi:hypothetical protein
VVIRHVAECHAPAKQCPFENSVAGIRRSGLHLVRNGLGVFVSRATDAAGVDDNPAVSQPHDARNVRVSAQNQRRDQPGGFGFDILDWGRVNDSVVGHPLQPVCSVISRRRVTQKHVVTINHRRRQVSQPIEVLGIQLLVIGAVRCAGPAQFDEQSILIAANGGKAARYQEIGRSPCLERPAGVVGAVSLKSALKRMPDPVGPYGVLHREPGKTPAFFDSFQIQTLLNRYRSEFNEGNPPGHREADEDDF